MALSHKQQIFIDEYLQCFNATEAARRAGYSEKTAYSIGHENLTKPEISRALAQRLQASAMSADEVLMRLAEQARASIEPFLNEAGEIQVPSGDAARLVKKLRTRRIVSEHSETVEQEIELHSSQDALVQLGKAHQLFVERKEVSGPGGGPIEFAADESILRRIDGIAARLEAEGILGGTGADGHGTGGA